MNYRERMKEYLKEPDEHSSQYGKWAILNREQRDLIKRLLREMDSADEVIKHQYFEIERLNNIINEFEDILKIDIKACDNKFEDVFDRNYRRLILEEKLEQLQELKGSDK